MQRLRARIIAIRALWPVRTGLGVPVQLENVATDVRAAAKADANGLYRFNKVLGGRDRITAAEVSLKDLAVVRNRTSTVNLRFDVGFVRATPEVQEAQAIDTRAAQRSSNYQAKTAADLPVAAVPTGGDLNPSLLGSGIAGSVGGPNRQKKLFYCGLNSYDPLGQASTPSAATYAPGVNGALEIPAAGGLHAVFAAGTRYSAAIRGRPVGRPFDVREPFLLAARSRSSAYEGPKTIGTCPKARMGIY